MNLNDSNNSTESLSISISPKETSKLIADKIYKTPNNEVKKEIERSDSAKKSINGNKCPTCNGKIIISLQLVQILKICIVKL